MWTYSDREISDLHKDVTGFRPDPEWWGWWMELTQCERQCEWDRLVSLLGDEENLKK